MCFKIFLILPLSVQNNTQMAVLDFNVSAHMAGYNGFDNKLLLGENNVIKVKILIAATVIE